MEGSWGKGREESLVKKQKYSYPFLVSSRPVINTNFSIVNYIARPVSTPCPSTAFSQVDLYLPSGTKGKSDSQGLSPPNPASMDNLNFILIDRSGDLVDEWRTAFAKQVPGEIQANFKMITTLLSDLEGEDKIFDCIVSPANSYGRLDGG